MGWPELVSHSFWKGDLDHLAKDFSGTLPDVHASSTTVRTSSVYEHGGGSALGRIKGVDLRRSAEHAMGHLDMPDGSRPGECLFIL